MEFSICKAVRVRYIICLTNAMIHLFWILITFDMHWIGKLRSSTHSPQKRKPQYTGCERITTHSAHIVQLVPCVLHFSHISSHIEYVVVSTTFCAECCLFHSLKTIFYILILNYWVCQNSFRFSIYSNKYWHSFWWLAMRFGILFANECVRMQKRAEFYKWLHNINSFSPFSM